MVTMGQTEQDDRSLVDWSLGARKRVPPPADVNLLNQSDLFNKQRRPSGRPWCGMSLMNHKWKWLADWSHGVHIPCHPHSPRRIVAPERLESRIAPGVMLPLFGSQFDGEGSLADEGESSAAHQREACHYYRAEAVAPAIEERLVAPLFVEKILAEDKTFDFVPAVCIPESRVPYEIAVLDAAFESFSDDTGSIESELPPLLIQPVITDPASPHNQGELGALPLPPPMIQPVITDPNSEFNDPSFTGELQATAHMS